MSICTDSNVSIYIGYASGGVSNLLSMLVGPILEDVPKFTDICFWHSYDQITYIRFFTSQVIRCIHLINTATFEIQLVIIVFIHD